MDVLGHSAGASLALLHAAAHSSRLSRLVLVTPSLLVTGLDSGLGAEHDLWPIAAACETARSLFPEAALVVQQGGGHYPWLDDSRAFVAAIDHLLR